MPSDSVATFLDLAKEQQLLPPEEVELLFRQPDMPQSGLSKLCGFLQNRGVLTQYQADKIRAGSGADLNFAGYPILDELGECPSGKAYKAVRRGSTTPLLLRRLRAEWFAPADNAAAFVQRVRQAARVEHPHLLSILDTGVHADETFVVTEQLDGKDLRQLVTDIGPMPAALAAEFARQAARGVEAVHARGFFHGDLRPDNLLAGPLIPMSKPRADGTPRYRPGPTATIKVAELGLSPRRPPASEWVAPTEEDLLVAAYLPPERFGQNELTAAGDVYMLGGTLFFLLTGQPPFVPANIDSLRGRKTMGRAPALDLIRPDAPAPLVQLVAEMLESDPEKRPSISAAAERLEAIVRTAQQPPPPKPPPEQFPIVSLTPTQDANDDHDNADVELAVAEPPPAGPESLASLSGVDLHAGNYAAPGASPPGWPAVPPPPAFVPPAYMPEEWGANAPATELAHQTHDAQATERAPRKARVPFSRAKLYLWLLVGLVLQLIAVAIWYFMIFGSRSDSEPDPSPAPSQNKTVKQPRKGKPG